VLQKLVAARTINWREAPTGCGQCDTEDYTEYRQRIDQYIEQVVEPPESDETSRAQRRHDGDRERGIARTATDVNGPLVWCDIMGGK